MTYKEITHMIESFGLPVAYEAFDKKEDVIPPYICYYYLGDNDLHADNYNYQPIRTYNIELCTSEKDIDLENIIEQKLKLERISYTRNEEYDYNERVYVVTYTIQTVITK